MSRISAFDPIRWCTFQGVIECGDKYQKKRFNLNPFVFFNREAILSVYLRRRQTRLFIGIRAPYEKVIPYKPTYQKSLVSHSNRFPHFDVKYIYNYQVMAWLWHHLIIIIIMSRPIPAQRSPPSPPSSSEATMVC